jgi:hypothetical protein
LRIAATVISAFEYSKFINLEKRSTFLIIHAENELKNSSAGLAKTFDDSGVVPNSTLVYLIFVEPFYFEVENDFIEYSIIFFACCQRVCVREIA